MTTIHFNRTNNNTLIYSLIFKVYLGMDKLIKNKGFFWFMFISVNVLVPHIFLLYIIKLIQQ